MARTFLLAALLVSSASVASAQLSTPSPFVDAGVGAQFITDLNTNTSNAQFGAFKEKVNFTTGVAGFGELGMTTDINPIVKGLGFVGVSFGDTKFDYDVTATDGDYRRSLAAVDGSLITYYAGVGAGFEIGSRFEVGANAKLGGSRFAYNSFAATQLDTAQSPTATTILIASDEINSFMAGPELKVSFDINPQIEFVATGNTMIHFNDANVFEAERAHSYYVGGGVRFKLMP